MADDDSALPLVRGEMKPDAEHQRIVFRLKLVALLNGLYCLVQLAAAVWFDSLSLLSDAFHNMSDVIAVLVALWAHNARLWGQSEEMTHGWARAEILGGLINGVLLLGLCLLIFLEALPRYIHPPEIDASWLLIGVAAAGLPVNLAGVLLFCGTGHTHSHGLAGGHGHSHGGHGHSHGGHGHSHGGHGHSHAHSGAGATPSILERGHSHDSAHTATHLSLASRDSEESFLSHHTSHSQSEKNPKENMNLFAVFAHSLGDAAASLFVCIGGLLIHYFDDHQPKGYDASSCVDNNDCQWTDYVDPTFSIILIIVILIPVLPLIKHTSHILMEGTPREIRLRDIQLDLQNVEGVHRVLDLHVMRLGQHDLMGTCHLLISDDIDGCFVVRDAKSVFHAHGVHMSTIQVGRDGSSPCTATCRPSTDMTLRAFSMDLHSAIQ